MTYQYITAKMPYGEKEQVWTERLNAHAAEGWRLVALTVDQYKGGSTTFATFERELPT